MQIHSATLRAVLVLTVAGLFLAGCSSPSSANILLRKKNQTLADQVDQLTKQHKLDLETLAACQRSHPTTASLSPDQLEQLVTTHGLTFGKLTAGDNPDSTQSFDTQLKVYVAPIDADGSPIKTAGSFKVEAFDLGDPTKPLIGTWTFDPKLADTYFYCRFLSYTYVLPCPFQKLPAHSDITVRVTFDDSLTGREFVGQVDAKVRLAPVSH